MSRLDAALNRAKSTTPDEVSPAPEVAATPGAVFAIEPEPDGAQVTELSAADVLRADEPTVRTESPVIEVESDLKSLPAAEKLAAGRADSSSIEQYRRLAARLLIAQAEHNIKVVMVTSAIPGEGKTLTSTNLALTLSESYKKNVLLMDADLRHPSVHEIFRIPNISGLNDGLRSEGDRKLPLIQYTENMSILTAGRPDSDPMSVLSGERLRQVFDEASRRFDMVIVDTPPVALLTDAHLLASRVDAVLLVVESGRTPLPSINKAVESVGRDKVLGVVLNRAEAPAVEYGGRYYYATDRTVA